MKDFTKYRELEKTIDLNNLYHEQGLSAPEISIIYGVGTTFIIRLMKKRGIIRRPIRECHKTKKRKYDHIDFYQLYTIKKLNLTKIGKILGCYPSTVSEYLNRKNIKSRNISEAKKMEAKRKLNPLYIKTDYINKKMSMTQIAQKYNCSSSCVKNTMSRERIKPRSRSEVKLNELNPMWKGEERGYAAIHSYIKSRKIKKNNCESCGLSKPLDLANISQEYHRDINDYEWLCRLCHMKKDGRYLKFVRRIHSRKAY